MHRILSGLSALLACVPAAHADVRSRAAQETAEFLLARFGTKTIRNVPATARKIEGLVARHGDVAIEAVRKGGPNAIHLVESAGANGGKAVAVLAAHGEVGAARVLSRPAAMNQVVRYGEQAAAVLCKHPGVAEGMIERGGAGAIRALGTVTPRNGCRLAMLLEGDLAHVGRHPEILEVVSKHGGDKVADFIWRNKKSLAVGTAMTAFLLHPEPFITGAKDITEIAGKHVAAPITRGIATAVNIALIGAFVLVGGGVILAFKKGILRPDEIRQWWAKCSRPATNDVAVVKPAEHRSNP
jgi:hypothetical protein